MGTSAPIQGDFTNQPPWFVFAGGGTGGHLFPALSVTEVLRSRCPQVEVSFFCTERRLDAEVLAAAHVGANPQTIQPLPHRPWRWPKWWLSWRTSLAACREAFSHRSPAVVVGAGGYASGPPVWTALAMGIPTFLLNPDAVPGRANYHLARRKPLRGVFAQWEQSRNYFPTPVPVMVTGCPIRAEFQAINKPDLVAVQQAFGLEPGRKTLLVTGASQGARTINEAVIELVGTMDFSGWQVLHLAGAADLERVNDAYARAKSKLGIWRFHGKVLPFTDRMAEAIYCADLIISRAGASTLAEITAAGKPSVLMPYPYHRDHHQRHNALVLVEAGAAVLVEDTCHPGANASRLGPVLNQLMQDEARRATMAAAAGRLGRPDAAERIAHALLEAAGLKAAGAEGTLPLDVAHGAARQTA